MKTRRRVNAPWKTAYLAHTRISSLGQSYTYIGWLSKSCAAVQHFWLMCVECAMCTYALGNAIRVPCSVFASISRSCSLSLFRSTVCPESRRSSCVSPCISSPVCVCICVCVCVCLCDPVHHFTISPFQSITITISLVQIICMRAS